MKTASSTKTGLWEKLRDYITSVKNLASQSDEYFEGYIEDCLKYISIYEAHGGKCPEESSVFEIGYGAKPLRLFVFDALGYNVEGIDMDAPLLRPSFGEYWRLLKGNGLERFLKSAGRNLLFDRRHYRQFTNLMGRKGHQVRINTDRLLVGDATRIDFKTDTKLAPYDMIFSDDVFEHIPRENISGLLVNLLHACHENTILLIRPNIFTGITGGHLKEWYPGRVGDDSIKRSQPWEHLRKDRFRPNTYLNRLWRKDYRELFSASFDVLDEIVMKPDLGREFLIDECKEELKAIPDEELFSNQVVFVLRPKP